MQLIGLTKAVGAHGSQTRWNGWMVQVYPRYNMFTPRSIVAVLQQIDQFLVMGCTIQPLIFSESGISGTLNKLTKDLKNVYAKTGTLTTQS